MCMRRVCLFVLPGGSARLLRMRSGAVRAVHAQSLSFCVTRLQCASPAPASRHNPWDTLTHAIASISPGPDAPSLQIDRNDWPHQDKRRQVRNNMMF